MSQLPSKIVLASGNAGKLKEMSAVLAKLGRQLQSQADFNTPEIEETGLSFVENAILKARNAAQHSGLAAIADDSGLCVDALNGAPGIYSARYAALSNVKGNSDDASNNAKLLEQLAAKTAPEQRRAYFYCALVFVAHAEDPTPIICEGRWHGHILEQAQGENGFGYDPLFFVPEQQCSSAQLPSELKNKISHRGQAMAALIKRFSAMSK